MKNASTHELLYAHTTDRKNKTQRREEVESETQKMGRREGEKEEKRGRRCRRRRFSEKQ